MYDCAVGRVDRRVCMTALLAGLIGELEDFH